LAGRAAHHQARDRSSMASSRLPLVLEAQIARNITRSEDPGGDDHVDPSSHVLRTPTIDENGVPVPYPTTRTDRAV
jgi:hypothetical protein